MEPGNYLGTINKAAYGKSQNDKPQFAVEFNLTHVEIGGAWSPLGEETVRTVYLSLSGGAKPYTVEKMKSLGFDGKFTPGEDGAQMCVFSAGSIEKQHGVKAFHDTYNGETKLKFELIRSGGGVDSLKKASDEDVMQVAALFA